MPKKSIINGQLLNTILDQYRKSFPGGIIPSEDKLHIAFYVASGFREIADNTLKIYNGKGQLVHDKKLVDTEKSHES